MNTWILIILLTGGNGVSSLEKVEFDTEIDCMLAQVKVQDMSEKIDSVCLPASLLGLHELGVCG